MHKFRKLKFAAILVMIFAIFASLLPAPAMAEENDNGAGDLTKRILYNMLSDCYRKEYMSSTIKLGAVDYSGELGFYKDIESIFEETKDHSLKDATGDEHFITNDEDEVEDSVYCKEVFARIYAPNTTPVITVDGRTNQRMGDTDDTVREFLKKLGYEKTRTDQAACVIYGYQVGERGKAEPKAGAEKHPQGAICWSDITQLSNVDNTFIKASAHTHSFPSITFDFYKLPESPTEAFADDTGGDILQLYLSGWANHCENYSDGYADAPKFHIMYNEEIEPHFGVEADGEGGSWSNEALNIGYCAVGEENHFFYVETYIPPKDGAWEVGSGLTVEPAPKVTVSSTYQLPGSADNVLWYRDALETARATLSSNEYAADTLYLDISWQLVYSLYIHYLVDYYGVQINMGDCASETDSSQRIPLSVGGKTRFCKVVTKKSEHKDDKVAVFANDSNDGQHSNTTLNTVVGFDDLVKKTQDVYTNNHDKITKLAEVDTSNGLIKDPFPTLSRRRENILTDRCYVSGGSQGWILCPLIQFAGNAMADLYGSVAKDFLTIESSLLQTGGNNENSGSGTYQAWSQFVGFGNIILIIFLLVIIFSQVTGVGIDNYGIKKALPKIIIAAVLINASFIICQLMVDLSNIIGGSLEDLLTGMGEKLIANASQLEGATYSGGGAFRAILDLTMILAGAGAVLGVVNAFATGGFLGLLIPLVIGLLIGLISILFFFTLLGIRKAAVVTLVAVSPIAFACYMLPNMKRQVFDRWFSIFKTMLIVYPICGLVIGGSNLASGILILNAPKLDNNGFLYYFIIMLLMVVPYLFLPSLIKKSMGVLGNLTQRASGAMRGLTRKGGDRASRWNKERPANQQRVAARNERRQQRWAERTSNRYKNGTGRGLGRIGAVKRRRDARLDAAIQAMQQQADVDAMRQARVENRASFIDGSAAKAALEAEKAKGEIKNYTDADFVAGTGFYNNQQVIDARRRGERYADAMAQEAYKKRLAATRDKEEKEDANYSTQTALAATKQANISGAAATMEKNMASLLAAGQLEVNGKRVNQNDRASLRDAYTAVLKNLSTATAGSEEYRVAMGQAGAIQAAMMKSGGGRQDIYNAYANVAASGSISDNVRMAAQNFAAVHGDSLKDKGMHYAVDMLEDMSNDVSAADIKAKINDSSYVADNIGELSPAKLKDFDPEALEQYVNYANQITAYEQAYNNSPFGSPVPPPSATEIGVRDRFNTEIYQGYFSSQNTPNRTEEISAALSKFKPPTN